MSLCYNESYLQQENYPQVSNKSLLDFNNFCVFQIFDEYSYIQVNHNKIRVPSNTEIET